MSNTYAENSEIPNPRSPRRFGAMAAGAAAGVIGLTGSMLALSQVAGADPEAEPAVVAAEEAVETDDLDLERLEAEFAEFDQCLVDNGVLSAEDLELMYSHDGVEIWEDGEWEDAPWEDAPWEDGEWQDGEWIEEAPHVAVVSGDQMTVVDFGEGDGSVTINKVDGEISVSSTGDVTEESIDFAELEGEFAEFEQEFAELGPELEAEMAAWGAAIEACEHLAPEGAIFDDVEIDNFDESHDSESHDSEGHDSESHDSE